MPYKDPEIRKQYARDWYTKNRDRISKKRLGNRDPRYQKVYNAKAYGLIVEQYDAIQAEPCSLCGSSPPSVIDHDHETGSIRGPLCKRCNWALGALGDSIEGLQKAIQYLEVSWVAK